MANLNSFVTGLVGGGARANQFTISIVGANVPGTVLAGTPLLCRSGQIPAMTVGEVAVPYRGRQVFIAGDRTYDAWTITVFSDGAMAIRKGFELWQHNIAQGGLDTTGAGSPTRYYAEATVIQQDRTGTPISTYKLQNVWPQTVDAIDLAWDTNDAVMEFGVTLRFNGMTGGGMAGGGPAG